MLESINPVLSADVPYALRAMGHGDRLVVCDTDFPADSIARQTVLDRLLRIDNVSATTGERRCYGCFLFSKGVIGSDGE